MQGGLAYSVSRFLFSFPAQLDVVLLVRVATGGWWLFEWSVVRELAADLWGGIPILSMCSAEEGNIWYVILTPRGVSFTYFHSRFSPVSTACDLIPKDAGSYFSLQSIPVLPQPPRKAGVPAGDGGTDNGTHSCPRDRLPGYQPLTEFLEGRDPDCPCTALDDECGKHATPLRSRQQEPRAAVTDWPLMSPQLPQRNPTPLPPSLQKSGLPARPPSPGLTSAFSDPASCCCLALRLGG